MKNIIKFSILRLFGSLLFYTSFIAIFFIGKSYAQVDKKSVILPKNSSLLWFSEDYLEIEREYEADTRIIDEAYSRGLISSLELYHHTDWNEVQLGGGISYLADGVNSNKFDRDLSLDNSKQEDIKNLGNPFFEVIKKVDGVEGDFKQYLKAKIIFPGTTKEHLHFDERNIAFFSYLFSYAESSKVLVRGEVFTRYYGKIKTTKAVVGSETREAFTEVGFSFYPSISFDWITIIPLLGFSLSTDYNTHNQYFSRLTDKGFSYYGGLEVRGQYKNYFVSAEFFASSFVFNSISDDTSTQIDNEIEKRSIKINLGLLF